MPASGRTRSFSAADKPASGRTRSFPRPTCPCPDGRAVFARPTCPRPDGRAAAGRRRCRVRRNSGDASRRKRRVRARRRASTRCKSSVRADAGLQPAVCGASAPAASANASARATAEPSAERSLSCGTSDVRKTEIPQRRCPRVGLSPRARWLGSLRQAVAVPGLLDEEHRHDRTLGGCVGVPEAAQDCRPRPARGLTVPQIWFDRKFCPEDDVDAGV